MASFTNLAVLASSLGTKYLNQAFTVSREVRVWVLKILSAAEILRFLMIVDRRKAWLEYG
jgi:hypothetical protein